MCLGLESAASLSYEAKCLKRFNQETSYSLSIITLVYSIPSKDDENIIKIDSKQSILYTCEANNCNSLAQYKKLNSTIKKDYHLSKTFQTLNDNDEELKKKRNATVSNTLNINDMMSQIINSLLLTIGYVDEIDETTTSTTTITNKIIINSPLLTINHVDELNLPNTLTTTINNASNTASNDWMKFQFCLNTVIPSSLIVILYLSIF
jgi:hypothetical protein